MNKYFLMNKSLVNFLEENGFYLPGMHNENNKLIEKY